MSTYSLQPLPRTAGVRGFRLLLLAPLVWACAAPPPPSPSSSVDAERMEALAEEQARDRERIASLESQIERMRADREVNEATRLEMDSEVRAGRNRTVAVSKLAEALISIDQAAEAAPWRPASVDEARGILVDAERLLQGGDPAAAVYFASRGRRIAETLLAEAARVDDSPQTRFVRATRLNLRAGPATSERVVGLLEDRTPVFQQRREGAWARVRTLDGELGWVHASRIHTSRPEAWSEAEREPSVAEADRPAEGKPRVPEADRPAEGRPTGPEPAQLATTAPGRVPRATFTTNVVDREPADSLRTLGRDHGHVFYFSELHGMQDRTVTHRWEHDGRIVAEIPFAVGGARWRVHSRKNLGAPGRGEWAVSVVDETGEILRRDRIGYDEAESLPPAAQAR